jgi:membrane-associated phospholipid phosphatase
VLDAALMAGAAIVLCIALLLAKRGVYAWEVTVFRPVNDLPDTIRPGIWALNQYGTIVTIPIVTVVALALRKWKLAAALAISGVVVYFLAKVVKSYVERGRPGALLAAVNEREDFAEGSLGFPSGHAAVAATITVVVLAYVGGAWGVAAIVLGAAVFFTRMYVAAHLPLDLIGGAAMGVAVALAAVLILGRGAKALVEARVPP